jgi:hypothetical protein
MLGSSLVAEQLAASQEGLSSISKYIAYAVNRESLYKPMKCDEILVENL